MGGSQFLAFYPIWAAASKCPIHVSTGRTPVLRSNQGVMPHPTHRVVTDDIGWGLCAGEPRPRSGWPAMGALKFSRLDVHSHSETMGNHCWSFQGFLGTGFRSTVGRRLDSGRFFRPSLANLSAQESCLARKVAASVRCPAVQCSFQRRDLGICLGEFQLSRHFWVPFKTLGASV